jgi:hypothetical protein
MVVEIINDQTSLLTGEADPVGGNQVAVVKHFQTIKNTGRTIFENSEYGVGVFQILDKHFTTTHIWTHAHGVEPAGFFIIRDAIGSFDGSQKADRLIR